MASPLLATALAARGSIVLARLPGWVHTDMGGSGATLAPAQSVQGLLRVIDGATLQSSGHFFDWRGNVLPW
jgi:hypothetical protein